MEVIRVLLLTGISLSEEDKELIRNCNIYKIALNQHAKELNPTARYCSDYVVNNIKQIDDKIVFSNRDTNGILVNTECTGSSLCDCAIWLNKQGCDVLIIGDNSVHEIEFQNKIKNCLKHYKRIYKFTKNGNFELPYIDLRDFINGKY